MSPGDIAQNRSDAQGAGRQPKDVVEKWRPHPLLGALGLALFFYKLTGSKWLFALVLVAFIMTRGKLVVVGEKPQSSGITTIGSSGE